MLVVVRTTERATDQATTEGGTPVLIRKSNTGALRASHLLKDCSAEEIWHRWVTLGAMVRRIRRGLEAQLRGGEGL